MLALIEITMQYTGTYKKLHFFENVAVDFESGCGTINRSPTRAAALLATDELALKFLDEMAVRIWVSGVGRLMALGVKVFDGFDRLFFDNCIERKRNVGGGCSRLD